MKKHAQIETKLADWTLAFNSMTNKQSEEAQILGGLITNLRTRAIGEGIVTLPGVA